jgi:hypothetical protein
MVSTGGGGPSLPLGGSPIEVVIALLVVVGVVWVAYKLLS